MRILELQRRLREVGRIRIGQKVATSNGKERPEKLDTFRLTSRDERVIRAAAEVWGGNPEPWTDAPDGGQWQVVTATSEMSVVVPPGDMAFSQAYEQWAAGGCKVRCDGQWDHVSDQACHCDPEERACDIHSRLSVMLPDLPGLGVWRLDTQGYYAAVELGGVVDIIASHSERGVMLPARLRLEQRSVKRPGQGVKRFAVPVLDVDVHPLALAAGHAGVPLNAAATPVEIGTGNLTPVPAQLGTGAPPVAEQVAQVNEPAPKAARSNAQAPLPGTGLRPRTAREAEEEAPAVQLASDAQTRKMHKLFNEHGLTDRDERMAYTVDCIGRELKSSNELTKDEASKLIDELESTLEPERVEASA